MPCPKRNPSTRDQPPRLPKGFEPIAASSISILSHLAGAAANAAFIRQTLLPPKMGTQVAFLSAILAL
jgi:hypothetical protein